MNIPPRNSFDTRGPLGRAGLVIFDSLFDFHRRVGINGIPIPKKTLSYLCKPQCGGTFEEAGRMGGQTVPTSAIGLASGLGLHCMSAAREMCADNGLSVGRQTHCDVI
jgi:hypothetical protein